MQMENDAKATHTQPAPCAVPLFAARHQHTAMSVEPRGEVYERTLNWARSAAASSSVKTAQINALQE